MAAPSTATHYKDLNHNLGYKPLVSAYINMGGLWRLLPILYEYYEYVDPIGFVVNYANLYYEHINNNTIRFYGLEDQEIKVQLFLEPREDAWYE